MCHVTPQCPLNADKHWDCAGCDLMKNVAPNVTPNVALFNLLRSCELTLCRG